jgi:hypothetical protein
MLTRRPKRVYVYCAKWARASCRSQSPSSRSQSASSRSQRAPSRSQCISSYTTLARRRNGVLLIYSGVTRCLLFFESRIASTIAHSSCLMCALHRPALYTAVVHSATSHTTRALVLAGRAGLPSACCPRAPPSILPRHTRVCMRVCRVAPGPGSMTFV